MFEIPRKLGIKNCVGNVIYFLYNSVENIEWSFNSNKPFIGLYVHFIELCTLYYRFPSWDETSIEELNA